ncbi:trypsin-1-like [Cloeon dipterum]|uniref:trypsin-1-like n=1 Tax=Cloeon dipterum TaxID=197152 RepID=UPI003220016E
MLAKLVIILACVSFALGGARNRKLYGPQDFRAGEKIVGGSPAALGEIPWQVSLQYDIGFAFCGGSIISDRWILTAAHCSINLSPSEVRIIVGTLEKDNPGAVHEVANITISPNFNYFTRAGDIALWQTTVPIVFNANTSAAALSSVTPATGELTTTSGWGDTTEGGSASDVLLKVDVPIFDYDQCNATYVDFGGVPSDQICAGVLEGGIDSCQGDSGGPLFLAGGGAVVGVASWGNGCANPFFPGVYTDVAQHLDWIRSTTGI